eukprot:CAMPEP_0173154408 /NCGR_PEP_ID=MMETSP1105-20130129/13463_1 /TAXON_ID=2985 /ORGANISM="Ochromonas sp., Strain BG-1" /LENGTH=155 /DNA_ID=CAMNT_0014070579 /DNA_START=315 /DNA_END=778 /DNA_ORIENTATION=-
MITKIAEEIQKIPLANKAAYRRFFMQKIVAIKEVKEEFDNYLKQARDNIQASEENKPNEETEKSTTAKEEGDDDEEDEDDNDYLDDVDEEERPFTVEEIPTVEKCLNLFNEVIQCLKFTMKYFTDVADHMQKTASTSSEEEGKVQQWIAMIEREG